MEVINDKTEIQLAQVSDGRLQLGGLFDSLKVDVNKYKDIIESFKELDFSKAIFKNEDGKANWDAIAKSIKGCDQTALSYFKTMDDGKGHIDNTSASVEGMSAHLKKSGQMFTFAAIKAKLLNAAVNAGIMLIATIAINILVKALENAADSLEDVESRIQDNQTALSNYTSKVEELTKKLEELNQTKTKYLSDDERKELETETAYINSQIELYNQLAEAKEKAINDDYIKAATGNNQEIAYKKLWEELKDGDWKDFFLTFGKVAPPQHWYDIILPLPQLVKKVDDGNYFSEADKLLNEYQKLQNKYSSLQQSAVKDGNTETIEQNIEEIQSKMHHTAAELSQYIEQIQTARDALYNSEYRDDYADTITEMDEAIAKYQEVLTGNVYASKYLGANDLQRDLIGIRDVLLSISKDTGLSAILEPLILQVNKLISFLEKLKNYSFKESLNFKNIFLIDGLSTLCEQSSELIGDWEKFQNILKNVSEQFTNIIQNIASKFGLSDLLSDSEKYLKVILYYFTYITSKFGWIFKDAINAWNEAHGLDYSDRMKKGKPSVEEKEIKTTEQYIISDQITDAQESLDKFQSAVKSAADAYTTLLTGNYSSSELLDSIQAINKAASEMGKSIDWESISASDNPLQAIQNQIESVSESYANSILNGMGIDVKSDFGKMLANIVQETYESEAALSSLNKQIDSLQSAYNSLTDIVSSYNETGHITFDQLQTLLAMEPQYLSCLIDESGQLQLNQEAMQALANQRLNDARSQIISQAITELNELAYRSEQTAIEDNRAALTDNMETVTTYEKRLFDLIPTIGLATDEFIDLSNAINGATANGASGEQIDEVFENAKKKWKFVEETVKNIGNASIFGNIMGGSSSGSSSSSSSEFSETIDFFERRVDVLNDSLDLLKSNLENVTGSFAKNKLVDAELSITGEKFKNYSDALSMYSQKAEEALSELPADIASKVKDGAVSITDFIGEGNKDVVEAIKDYESWADKVSDCTKELAELKKEIRRLELEKFNNIISDFTNQFDLRENSKDLISKQMDLLKEAGELIGESFYSKQIEQSQKQLTLLEEEKAKLIEQMTSAIGSERVNCVPYSTVMWFKTK